MRGFIHWYIDGVYDSPQSGLDGVKPQLEIAMLSKAQGASAEHMPKALQISLRFHFEKQNAGRGLDFGLSMLGNYKSEQTNALYHDYIASPVAQAIVARIQREV